jgi:hypothetical protein
MEYKVVLIDKLMLLTNRLIQLCNLSYVMSHISSKQSITFKQSIFEVTNDIEAPIFKRHFTPKSQTGKILAQATLMLDKNVTKPLSVMIPKEAQQGKIDYQKLVTVARSNYTFHNKSAQNNS